MPRISRAVAPGFPHHVVQRGNYRQPTFEADADFEQYRFWLVEYCLKHRLKVWAYCLMNNHVHFVCVPELPESLARTFNCLHMRYSQYFNGKRNVRGHLWQGRFFSCVLDERHLHAAVKYVENNPVRAGIAAKAGDYVWSSALGHISRGTDPVLSGDCPLESQIEDWRAYLGEISDHRLIEAIRKNSLSGRPCGDDGFTHRMGSLLKRDFSVRPWGRPRKTHKK